MVKKYRKTEWYRWLTDWFLRFRFWRLSEKYSDIGGRYFFVNHRKFKH